MLFKKKVGEIEAMSTVLGNVLFEVSLRKVENPETGVVTREPEIKQRRLAPVPSLVLGNNLDECRVVIKKYTDAVEGLRHECIVFKKDPETKQEVMSFEEDGKTPVFKKDESEETFQEKVKTLRDVEWDINLQRISMETYDQLEGDGVRFTGAEAQAIKCMIIMDGD